MFRMDSVTPLRTLMAARRWVSGATLQGIFGRSGITLKVIFDVITGGTCTACSMELFGPLFRAQNQGDVELSECVLSAKLNGAAPYRTLTRQAPCTTVVVSYE